MVHTSVAQRDAHPKYTAAKAGDPDAALSLALDLLDDERIANVCSVIAGRPAILLPIIADETTGFNAIPDAMAQALSRTLDLPVLAGEIVQINKVGHTRAPAFQRLVTSAMFDGDVDRGAAYVLIDDHVGLGGTLANLRGYLEARDGSVIAITTLTESHDARRISLRPETRTMLWQRHSQELDRLWYAQLGMRSTVSPKSKASSYVVGNPLPASRVFWLRQQSKRVAAVSHLRFSSGD